MPRLLACRGRRGKKTEGRRLREEDSHARHHPAPRSAVAVLRDGAAGAWAEAARDTPGEVSREQDLSSVLGTVLDAAGHWILNVIRIRESRVPVDGGTGDACL